MGGSWLEIAAAMHISGMATTARIICTAIRLSSEGGVAKGVSHPRRTASPPNRRPAGAGRSVWVARLR
jgi:hypothetical protein